MELVYLWVEKYKNISRSHALYGNTYKLMIAKI